MIQKCLIPRELAMFSGSGTVSSQFNNVLAMLNFSAATIFFAHKPPPHPLEHKIECIFAYDN